MITATGPGAPARGEPLVGQHVAVRCGRYDWVHLVLAGAEPDWEDELWLYYRDGVDPEWLRVVGAPAGPGTVRARAAVPRRADLVGVRLPERPGVTLLALHLAVDPPPAAHDRGA